MVIDGIGSFHLAVVENVFDQSQLSGGTIGELLHLSMF